MNKWRPADTECKARQSEFSHALSKVPKPSVPPNILQRDWTREERIIELSLVCGGDTERVQKRSTQKPWKKMGLRSSVTSVRKRVLHFLICFWKRNCRERQTSLVWPARKIQSPPSLPTDTLLGSQQFNNHICNLWISVLLDIAISYDQLLTCTAKHLEKLHRLLHPFIFRWTSLATASCPTLFFFFLSVCFVFKNLHSVNNSPTFKAHTEVHSSC